MTDFEAREILIRIVTTLGVLFLMPWLGNSRWIQQ